MGLQDKGTSAENVIQIGRGPIGSARLSRSAWAAGDTIPSLTQRVLELETQIASIQADLENEQRRLGSYSDFDPQLNEAAANAYRKADAIRSRAQAEANVILERAVNERKMLLKEVDSLRQERDELEDEIASLRRGGLAEVPAAVEPEEAQPSFDLKAAVAEEMRAMLAALLEEVRARPGPTPAPSAAVAPLELSPAPAVEIAVSPPETPAAIVEVDVDHTRQPELAPQIDIESEDLFPETSHPLVDDHPDELATAAPSPSEARVDEHLEELRQAEIPSPSEIESEDILAETSQQIADEYVEEFRKPAASFEPSQELANDVVEDQPPRRVFDEYVEEFVEPEIAEPVVEEHVEDLRTAELPAPPASEVEIDLSPEKSEPIVDEFVEELRRSETPPAPETPAPTANLEALWETAAPPIADIEPAVAPPEAAAPIVEPMPPAAVAPLEPASFITDEFIAATRPGTPQDTESAAPPPFSDVPAPSPFVEEEEAPAPFADMSAAPPVVEPVLPPAPDIRAPAPPVSASPAVRQIQVLIAPIHSFPRLIEIQQRIQSLSSVRALQLRDFRNGTATFAVGVAEAISPQEFGAVIQMLENLHLRLEGTAQNSVELRVEDEPPTP